MTNGLAGKVEQALQARCVGPAGVVEPDSFTRLRRFRLRAAEIREVIRDFADRLRAEPPAAVIELALALADRGTFEGRHVGYELLAGRPDALLKITPEQVEQLGAGNDNWASVDGFACYVAGRAWRLDRIPDELVLKWATSPDRWWRRTALVATVPLNQRSQGGTGNIDRTLKICELLAADRDGMVVKAMSWALRALAVREPAAVQRFMGGRSGHRLASRVQREVTSKLTTGRKSPARGGTSG